MTMLSWFKKGSTALIVDQQPVFNDELPESL